MADDPSKRGKQDRDRINVDQEYEVRDWAKSLGVSEDELRNAVAKRQRPPKGVAALRFSPQLDYVQCCVDRLNPPPKADIVSQSKLL